MYLQEGGLCVLYRPTLSIDQKPSGAITQKRDTQRRNSLTVICARATSFSSAHRFITYSQLENFFKFYFLVEGGQTERQTYISDLFFCCCLVRGGGIWTGKKEKGRKKKDGLLMEWLRREAHFLFKKKVKESRRERRRQAKMKEEGWSYPVGDMAGPVVWWPSHTTVGQPPRRCAHVSSGSRTRHPLVQQQEKKNKQEHQDDIVWLW